MIIINRQGSIENAVKIMFWEFVDFYQGFEYKECEPPGKFVGELIGWSGLQTKNKSKCTKHANKSKIIFDCEK